MKLPHRRQFLHLAAGATALPALSRVAWGQAYPNKLVRLVVPFPAGGQTDIIGRIVGQWLSERLGRQFVIDNRAGAGGNIGTEAVVRAPADGYTLLLASATNAINATLYDNLSFNFIRDTTPVASVNRIPLVLVSHLSFPANSVAKLIAAARADPGKLTIAMPPKGTGPSMAALLFKMLTSIDVVLVPYRGDGPMQADIIGGQVQVAFGGLSAALEHIKAGKLRALAVAGAARVPDLPDVPTIGETVEGYESSGWAGIVAPRGTPAEIVERLHGEINAGLTDPKLETRLSSMGLPTLALSKAAFEKLIADETEKWGKVIRAANIKAD
jgi:tripartite-type tricarboxylate transporter receptor subunit TctC